MLKDECFECGSPKEHDHHVIPRSRGGKKTIPLCVPCHNRVHEAQMGSAALVKEGIRKARENGVDWGKARRGKHRDKIERLLKAGVAVSVVARRYNVRTSYVSQVGTRMRKRAKIGLD